MVLADTDSEAARIACCAQRLIKLFVSVAQTRHSRAIQAAGLIRVEREPPAQVQPEPVVSRRGRGEPRRAGHSRRSVTV